MRKDFAAKVRKPSKKVNKGKPKKKTAPRKKTGPSFHGPSFSAGTILGAIIVLYSKRRAHQRPTPTSSPTSAVRRWLAERNALS